MSGLNAKAKPFVFNPNAGSFTPGPSSSASSAAPSTSSPPPGFSAPKPATSPPPITAAAAVETFDLHNGDARPLTQPATNASDSWEELAEDSKAQSAHSIPVNAVAALAPADNSTTTSSPPPLAAAAVAPTTTAASSAAFPDASVTARPSEKPAVVDDVTKKIDQLALDEEEAKELADAAEEEALTRKPKKDDQKKAHDEREHINIVFIGHVDAGKYDTRTTDKHVEREPTPNEEMHKLILLCCVLLLCCCAGRRSADRSCQY